ncbi:MAG: bile acid:sodium symporter family protein [Lachnospiraceae bacterium]|nr:bile acid:sodium symporter family protein [Lachnospiraceae bacterium]
MNTVLKKAGVLSNYLTRYIGVIIVVFSIIAFFWNEGFAWTTTYTTAFLGVAMFGMGLTIKVDDFRRVFSRPKEILIGFVAQYTIMPLAAWLLCYLMDLPTDLALGVILVGCCPGGTASNVVTYIAGGDVALSVGMTITSTLAAPLMTPLLVYLLAGAWVEVSFWAMVISVVKVVLIPVLLGIFINWIWGKQIRKVSEVLPLISVVSIVMIISGIVAVNSAKILSCGLLVLGVVILHNLFGILVGLGTAKLFHIDHDKATAVALEVGMQNSGLSISLATANFAMNPLATLPGAIFSVWHNISGSVFAGIRRGEKEKAQQTLQMEQAGIQQ